MPEDFVAVREFAQLKTCRVWSKETGGVVFTLPIDATHAERLTAAAQAQQAALAKLKPPA